MVLVVAILDPRPLAEDDGHVVLSTLASQSRYDSSMSIQPAVYIMASRRNRTLYIGVTGALRERVYQHREGLVAGFTKQYGVKMLVHFELFALMLEAIAREKQLKKYLRSEKLLLIESRNENWRDLWVGIL
jgi:putative endonuclease